MKKLLIVTLIAGFSTGVFADDGKINFEGEVTDQACTVVNDLANPLKVTLRTVSKASLDGQKGKTAAATAFNIKLDNCPATVNSASVKFDGQSANNDNTALKLTQETDVAKGVGIQLSDHTNAVVPLYTESAAYSLTTGSNSIPFVARYIALQDTVDAGHANSTANFTVVYN